MIKIKQTIIVEGRYDKNKVKQLFDCEVFETLGFQIFKDEKRLALIRQIARADGIIILTDSDGAGLVIRNFLQGTVQGKVYHAYIPAIPGREKRKAGKTGGFLGVEGMRDEVIIRAVQNSGIYENAEENDTALPPPVTKMDLYDLGLTGAKNSAARRRELCNMLFLPENISANALLSALRSIHMERDALEKLISDDESRGC